MHSNATCEFADREPTVAVGDELEDLEGAIDRLDGASLGSPTSIRPRHVIPTMLPLFPDSARIKKKVLTSRRAARTVPCIIRNDVRIVQ